MPPVIKNLWEFALENYLCVRGKIILYCQFLLGHLPERVFFGCYLNRLRRPVYDIPNGDSMCIVPYKRSSLGIGRWWRTVEFTAETRHSNSSIHRRFCSEFHVQLQHVLRIHTKVRSEKDNSNTRKSSDMFMCSNSSNYQCLCIKICLPIQLFVKMHAS